MKNVLVINAGSSSLKYQLIDMDAVSYTHLRQGDGIPREEDTEIPLPAYVCG